MKVQISSPEAVDSMYTDFMDLRRFQVSPGSYSLELELKDLNNADSEIVTYSKEIEIPAYSGLSVSDAIYLSAWQKTTSKNELSRSGFDMLPRVSNLFESGSEKIGFYAEIYNSNAFFNDSSAFVLATYLENQTTGEVLKSSLKLKKLLATEIIPVFQTKDISNVAEGLYNLVIDVRNDKNQSEYSRKFSFLKGAPILQKSDFEGSIEDTFASEFTDPFQLYEHLISMIPQATPAEARTIIYNLSSYSNVTELQSFFYNFWFQRNQLEPKKEWNTYYDLVLAADLEFGTRIKRGYETDRGRIYLEYGPPNTRVKRPHETGAHPFEIWHYYKAGALNNVKFVFLDSEQSVNDYALIHSNMRGEIFNDNWVELILVDIAASLINPNRDDAANISYDDNGARFVIQDLYLNPR